MMRKLLLAFLLLAAVAGAQTVTRKITPLDLKYQVGNFDRPSQVTPGATVSRPGFTPINVLAFGVDNTGATDCADSLQAVVDSVGAWGGGAIKMPSGDYVFDNVTIDHDNITIFGENGTRIRPNTQGTSGTNSYVFLVTGDSCKISDMYFDMGAPYNGTYDYAICGYRANGLVVEDVTVLGSGYGVAVRHSDNVSVRSCEMSGFKEYGICVWGDADNVRISGNSCHNTSGTVTASGIKLAGAASDSTVTAHTNITVSNNICYSVRSGVDVAINSGRGLLLSGNIIDEVTEYGINYKFNTRAYADTTISILGGSIVGNTVRTGVSSGSSGINVQREKGQPILEEILVSGNIVTGPYPSSSPTRVGIRLYGGVSCSVVGNEISGYVRGIHLADSDSCIISGNTVTRTYIPVLVEPQINGMSCIDNYIYGNVLNAEVAANGAYYANPIRLEDDILSNGGPVRTRIYGNMTTSGGDLAHVSDAGTSTMFMDSNEYNVMMYGAAGDGDTDDTAEIQAAIDAADAAGGGIVLFPNGHYIVSSSLVIDDHGIRLIGSGMGERDDGTGTVIEFKMATPGDNGIEFSGSASLWNCEISNMRLMNASSVDAPKYMVLFNGCRNALADRIYAYFDHSLQDSSAAICYDATAYSSVGNILSNSYLYVRGTNDAASDVTTFGVYSKCSNGSLYNNNNRFNDLVIGGGSTESAVGVCLRGTSYDEGSNNSAHVLNNVRIDSEYGAYFGSASVSASNLYLDSTSSADTLLWTGANARDLKFVGGNIDGAARINGGIAAGRQPVFVSMFPGSHGVTDMVKVSSDSMVVGAARIYSGSRTPEGVIAAPLGSLYLRTGDTDSLMWVKGTDSSNAGWVLK